MRTDSDRRNATRRADSARADLLAHGVFPTTLHVREDAGRVRARLTGEHGPVEVEQHGTGRWAWTDRDGADRRAETTRDLVEQTGARRLSWAPGVPARW